MSELDDLHHQIERLLEVGRADEARRLAGRALALDPADPDTLCLLGAAAAEAGDHVEAKRHAHAALASSPDYEPARVLLFDVLVEEKAYAEAEAEILELLRDNPADPDHMAGYARLLVRVYQLDKARALVAEALRHDPDHAQAQVLDTLLHVIRGDDRLASARLGRMIAADPDASHVVHTAIVVLGERGKHREALGLARELLRARPNDPELVDTVIELRLASHWAMLPLRPLIRGGWPVAAVMWAVAVFGLIALRLFVGDTAAVAFGGPYFALVVYSWTGPPLLRRWLRWRGF